MRHKWQVGDLVIWDNRTLMHKATTDILPPDKFRLSTGSIRRGRHVLKMTPRSPSSCFDKRTLGETRSLRPHPEFVEG